MQCCLLCSYVTQLTLNIVISSVNCIRGVCMIIQNFIINPLSLRLPAFFVVKLISIVVSGMSVVTPLHLVLHIITTNDRASPDTQQKNN